MYQTSDLNDFIDYLSDLNDCIDYFTLQFNFVLTTGLVYDSKDFIML